MHILPETLLLLTSSDPSDFDAGLEEFEKSVNNIDINSIPQQDFSELFDLLCEKVVSEKEGDDLSYLSLRVLNYILGIEVLVEGHFEAYVALLQWLFLSGGEKYHDVLVEAVEHIQNIVSDYTERLEHIQDFPEYMPAFVSQIQQIAIDLYFFLQDLESKHEREKDIVDTDRTTQFGVVSSVDTRDAHLKNIRQCLELLYDGKIGNLMHDRGYNYRVSPVDPELIIMGRFEKIGPCATGCSCCE